MSVIEGKQSHERILVSQLSLQLGQDTKQLRNRGPGPLVPRELKKQL